MAHRKNPNALRRRRNLSHPVFCVPSSQNIGITLACPARDRLPHPFTPLNIHSANLQSPSLQTPLSISTRMQHHCTLPPPHTPTQPYAPAVVGLWVQAVVTPSSQTSASLHCGPCPAWYNTTKLLLLPPACAPTCAQATPPAGKSKGTQRWCGWCSAGEA